MNFWQSYGTECWRWLQHKAWAAAFNGSLEAWEVRSGGGSSSLSKTGGAPNIFNDSGHVFTWNLVGSFNVSLSWQPNPLGTSALCQALVFYLPTKVLNKAERESFMAPTLLLVDLFQPIPELGLTASVAQPIGSGTNSFDSDLVFSRVPISRQV